MKVTKKQLRALTKILESAIKLERKQNMRRLEVYENGIHATDGFVALWLGDGRPEGKPIGTVGHTAVKSWWKTTKKTAEIDPASDTTFEPRKGEWSHLPDLLKSLEKTSSVKPSLVDPKLLEVVLPAFEEEVRVLQHVNTMVLLGRGGGVDVLALVAERYEYMTDLPTTLQAFR